MILVLSAAAGLLLGIASRAVDTAAWAPSWIGTVVTPWLALAWLVGALSARPWPDGPMVGLAALTATVATYLLAAGTDAGALWLVLAPVALVGGPAYGWAGAAWRSRDALGRPGLALLGAALLVEGITLQLGDRVLLARIGFGVESLVGLAIIVLAWMRRP
jgi:hypothetical protein